MLHTLHRWQHTLLRVLFGMPEDAEPLQARHPALKNRPLQNHSLGGRHHRTHQPRILKRWQTGIGALIERRFAHWQSR